MELYGYIKANKLTSEYIVRQDMEDRKQADIISKNDFQKGEFKIEEQIIKVQNINFSGDFQNSNVEESLKVWGIISNRLFENQINNAIKDYKTRTELIDTIVNNTIENNINGIVIDFSKIEEENINRFLIELTPKLREIGINTCIVLNDNMKKDNYKNIVDYIVE